MSYPEFSKLMFDGDEGARRAPSSPSNIFFVEMGGSFAASHLHKKEGSPGDFLHGQQQEALAITGDLRYLLDHLPQSCAYLAVPIVSSKLRDLVIYLLTATYH